MKKNSTKHKRKRSSNASGIRRKRRSNSVRKSSSTTMYVVRNRNGKYKYICKKSSKLEEEVVEEIEEE